MTFNCAKRNNALAIQTYHADQIHSVLAGIDPFCTILAHSSNILTARITWPLSEWFQVVQHLHFSALTFYITVEPQPEKHKHD